MLNIEKPSRGHFVDMWSCRSFVQARIVTGLICFVAYSFLFVFWFCEAVHAGGFRIMDHSASAAGQSAAFTAQADDPSAIFYNPAGMTQLKGVQISTGTLLIGGDTSFTSSSGTTSKGNFNGSLAFPPPSNFYLTANLKDLGFSALGNLSLGLGVHSPFGVLYRWPNNSPFATAVTFASLQLIDIKPTLAYKISKQLSVGLGADIYTFCDCWGEGQAEQQFLSSGGTGLPPAGTRIEINGSDTQGGFNVSLLYTPFHNSDGKPLVNIGFVYRSQAVLHLDGEFLANGTKVTDASTTLVLPQAFTGGIALWPTRDASSEWKLELDVDYTGWKSFRNLDVHLSNGATIPNPQNWRNSFMIMLGTEYKWLQLKNLPDWEVAVRGGYWFSQTPVPDSSFNPAIPDADHHSISVGGGLFCKRAAHFLGTIPCGNPSENLLKLKGVGIDLAFQALLYEPRTVTGNMNPVAIPGSVNGRYKTTYYLGAISLRASF